MSAPTHRSILTCPSCGHQDDMIMPTDACLFFHPCGGCGELLRPRTGDCCVFCSYGTVACPPKQTGNACCGSEITTSISPLPK